MKRGDSKAMIRGAALVLTWATIIVLGLCLLLEALEVLIGGS